MVKVFVGDDRVRAAKAVESELGGDYEVFEGESLTPADLPSIFQGTSLFGGGSGGGFGEKRQILLKDLGENGAVWEKIVDYLETEHEVIIWETKIDKRSAGYKRLKEAGVEIREFNLAQKPEMRQVFGIFDTALRDDGEAAVRMVEEIELEQDPYMFLGLMVTQALKKFEAKQGSRERRVVKMLAELDMQMKGEANAYLEPWTLVKMFLLEVGNGKG